MATLLSPRSRTTNLVAGFLIAGAAAALVSSCGGGGGGDGDTATATVFDTPSVVSAIKDFEGLIAVCQDTATAALKSARQSSLAPVLLRSVLASLAPVIGIAGLPEPLAATAFISRKELTSVPPADELGSCGGRFGFRDYSHVNGVTTAKLSFEDYCQLDPGTGERQLISGSIAFVNTATPTPSGPMTTGLEASTVNVLNISTQTSSGVLLSTQTLGFSDFKMAIGVPGGIPSASEPNKLSIREINVTNSATGKSYRHVDYALTQFQNDAIQAEWAMTGRGYRSDGTYFDIATTSPVVMDSTGLILGGQLTFSGANGSQVVANLMPGPTLLAALSINGAPLTAVPACGVE